MAADTIAEATSHDYYDWGFTYGYYGTGLYEMILRIGIGQTERGFKSPACRRAAVDGWRDGLHGRMLADSAAPDGDVPDGDEIPF